MLLSLDLWDLVVDANGNWGIATDPYSVAQDVASICRVFQGEEYYNTTAGIPYFQNILAQLPSAGFMKAVYAAQASLVPGCANPVVFFSGLNETRVLTGQIQFTDSNGVAQVAGF
jgi:hypothetical protein